MESEFTVSPVAYRRQAAAMVTDGICDIWIVDVDSKYDLSADWRSFLEEVTADRQMSVVLMTTDENRPMVAELAEDLNLICLRKPPAIRELKIHLRKAYEQQSLGHQLQVTRQKAQTIMGLDQMTGTSAPMMSVYDLVRRVAKLDASVLITGESGTGKELVARAIHNTGTRSDRPFVAISCGAIPESLIEAELFGHEKGAFTGTVGSREGYFEQAGDGTLFLDEIGELSPNTQVKLLRVLQQREFNRLGSSRAIPLRARIIFATHRDLGAMVAQGKFRQDLFYRINVMNIGVPPLRNRTEDVPMLAQSFLQRYSELYGKQMESIDADALCLLRAYSWPGNVRELENVMQRAIIMAEDHYVRVSDLPPVIQDLEVTIEHDDLPAGSFERMLRDYKLKIVRDAIEQYNGNKTLAAQSLSISRAYLHRLIRQPADEIMLQTASMPFAASATTTQ